MADRLKGYWKGFHCKGPAASNIMRLVRGSVAHQAHSSEISYSLS